ncbi:hypothetical protein JTB14_018098 [Gonioctena quinquepunctata]|nr:hypothetical protein JTB14_018098 [Gonioctena quinquepunctata]
MQDEINIIEKEGLPESLLSRDEQRFQPGVEQKVDLDDEQQVDLDDEQQLQSEQAANANSRHRKPNNRFVSDEHHGWDEEGREVEKMDSTGITSINIHLPADAKTIDYLDRFFTMILSKQLYVRLIGEVVNRFLIDLNEGEEWKEVTIQEMRKFLGLCASEGIVKSPSLAKQWRRQIIHCHLVFERTKSRYRFPGILNMLRCVNYTGINTEDRLHKISNVRDAIVENIRHCYYPDRELSIDD